MRRVLGRCARLLRWLRIGSGPLKRGSDRLEMVFRLLVVVAFLVAAPVGLAVGRAIQHQQSAVATQQARERHSVQAVVLADPDVETDTSSNTVTAAVTWTFEGTAHTGTTLVPVASRAGSSVPIWVTSAGKLTGPPLDAGSALSASVCAGFVAAVGVPLVAGCLLWLARSVLDLRRARQWEAGWQAVEPLWTSNDR